MTQVFLGLGSNIEPQANIELGLQLLRARFQVRQESPWYRSAAWGFAGPEFINLVVEIDYAGELASLAQEIKALEFECGRPTQAQKFVSRRLDVDVLLFGALQGTFAGICLPRAEVRERAYVAQPLADIFPEGLDPLTGKTFAQLAQALNMDGLTRL